MALAAALLVVAALGAPACTDADVFETPGVGKSQQDNKLQVRGNFCTEHPDELNFPVKIMFIIDCSQSMIVTDPPPTPNEYPGRVRAVWDVIKQFRYDPGVSFAILRFESAANVATQRDTNGDGVADSFGFINDLQSLLRALLSLQSAGGNTSYQSALALAEATLAMDMSSASVEERGRTKYVVIFLSDGLPYPQNFDQDINTPFSITRTLREMMNLPKRFDVRDFTFHTAYLSVDTPDYVKKQAEELLQDMADIGGGTYRNFTNGEEINFLDFDYTSVKRMHAIKNGAFLVSNANVHPAATRADSVDTDGDGLIDDVEKELGTDIGDRDTDGDGFNDLLEYNLRRSGFDPLDPQDADCRLALDRLDRDGDELLDCEERFIGTSPELFDTDSDGLPDTIEQRTGTNAVWADHQVDYDYDGSINGSEVAWHTNPLINDAAQFSKLAYRYQLGQRAGVFESRLCYDFEVANITLVGTQPRKAGELEGFNDVMVYVGQVPQDDPTDFGTFRVACARARYIPRYPDPDIKYPPNGVVKFTQRDFKRPVASSCTSEEECPYHVCDPRTHTCLAPLGQKCDEETPCPNFSCVADPISLKSTCSYPVQAACMTSDDCPPYPVNPVTQVCMDPLKSAPDPVSGLCPKAECVPAYTACSATVPCNNPGGDPSLAPVCLNDFCRSPCYQSSDCNAGETCEPDREKEYPGPCQSAADCPNVAMVCDNSICRTPCLLQSDCPALTDSCEAVAGGSSMLCIGHHCVDHHGGQCTGVDCATDTDCPLQPCDEEVGHCRVQACLDSRECPHQACEIVVGKCMGTTCADDSECRGERGYSCNDIVGDPCERDIDCPFDFCTVKKLGCYMTETTTDDDGNTVPLRCLSNADCPAGRPCLNGTCYLACASATDCPANTCVGAVPNPDPLLAVAGRCALVGAVPCFYDSDCMLNFCKEYRVCSNDESKYCDVSLDCGKPSFCVVDINNPATGTCMNNPGQACSPATENTDNLCQVGMCSRDNGLGKCDTVGQESCPDTPCPNYTCNNAAATPTCLFPTTVVCSSVADCPYQTYPTMTCTTGICTMNCSSDLDCPTAACKGRCLPLDPATRRRCTDWFDADLDCKVFGGEETPAGP
jgi:hypothetical protein